MIVSTQPSIWVDGVHDAAEGVDIGIQATTVLYVLLPGVVVGVDFRFFRIIGNGSGPADKYWRLTRSSGVKQPWRRAGRGLTSS